MCLFLCVTFRSIVAMVFFFFLASVELAGLLPVCLFVCCRSLELLLIIPSSSVSSLFLLIMFQMFVMFWCEAFFCFLKFVEFHKN